ncbi:MAG TPA: hypothetical protein VHP11_02835, partial [Tepidisphaeraceae bacterium]|nr:hypothetical protein [Tepidisphaeraceae bacterium]
MRFTLIALLATALLGCASSTPTPYFQIQVIDEQTGRGVPLVELETVNNQRLLTDSNGIIAFNEPGLMGQPVYFHVRSHGYEYPKDGFGFAGVRLTPVAGSSVQIPLKRRNVAQRLYRVTGQGIYRDSVLTGAAVPLQHPVINGNVLGQDSVFTVLYQNRIYWFWGDTNRPSYPLGQFAMSGATSQLPSQGGLDPNIGVNLVYFIDEQGFSRKMAPLPGEGLFWLEGFLVVPDPTGRQRLIGRYNRMKSLSEMVEQGLAIFNDQTQSFEKLIQFRMDQQWQSPRAHPLRVSENGQDYFYFPTPFPTVRVKADYQHLIDPSAYEAFSCLRSGSRYDKSNPQLDRTADGKIIYAWKPNTDPTGQKEERELIAAGKLQPREAHFQVRDVDSDQPVSMHGGSIYWNNYRQRYIMIAVQEQGSSSYLGEVYFAEAASPIGPWTFAKKILTHDKYTFYNPKQHPLFDQDNGRVIFFEGTYANTFSGNPLPTPRYDYNQIMYRLD